MSCHVKTGSGQTWGKLNKRTVFPQGGMKPLVDYARSKSIQMGWYMNNCNCRDMLNIGSDSRPPGRARPRRQSQSEGAWRGRRPSTWAPLRRASAQMVQGGTSPTLDEPNWIFYDELESVAAGSSICQRQKPQRFIRAFRALHISRSSTRLSPSDPSRSASPRSLGAWRTT